MTRHWDSTLGRVARWLKPSAESFAAAAAVYGLDLLLQLKATPGALERPPSRACDGRSREIGPLRRGAVPAARSRHELHFADRTPPLGQPRPAVCNRMGWQDGTDGDLRGARRCPAR
jgi:hypothetical protein